jgi:hypothetical protein
MSVVAVEVTSPPNVMRAPDTGFPVEATLPQLVIFITDIMLHPCYG